MIWSFLIPYPIATSLLAPQTRPSCSIERTAASRAAMSVSSSQGLTSMVTTDYERIRLGFSTRLVHNLVHTLAMVFGLLAFFSLYAAIRSALTLSASASTSSSDPKRSISSSSASASAAGAEASPPRKASPAVLDPGRDSCSAA